MKKIIRKVLNKAGLDIVSFPYFRDKQKLRLFEKFGIKTIVDVGANMGQFADSMWNLGYEGTIISFEPVKSTYDKLEARSLKKQNWVSKNSAIGDKVGSDVIHVTENTLSSSLLKPNDVLLSSTPEARVVRADTINVTTIDAISEEIFTKYDRNYFLKIDAQGYEDKILRGSQKTLEQYSGIQIELSIKSLYQGEQPFIKIFPFIMDSGFQLYEIGNGYCHPQSGEVMQVEAIFFKS